MCNISKMCCQSIWICYNKGVATFWQQKISYIGKGYGRLLLNKCIEELKQCGFSKVLLWVLEDNHRARKFYEKNGFIFSKIFIDDNIGGKDVREVLYFHI